MLRTSPNDGTPRLPNDDDDEIGTSQQKKYILTFSENPVHIIDFLMMMFIG